VEAALLVCVALVTTFGLLGIDKAVIIAEMKKHLLELKVLRQAVGFLQNGF
jgi:hypothetical protein